MEKYAEVIKELEQDFRKIAELGEIKNDKDIKSYYSLAVPTKKKIFSLFYELLRPKEIVGYENPYLTIEIFEKLYEFDKKNGEASYLRALDYFIPDGEFSIRKEKKKLVNHTFSDILHHLFNDEWLNYLKDFILNQKNYYREENLKFFIKDSFFDAKNKKIFPLNIQRISVNTYKSLENIKIDSIPLDTQFIVFTGDNGEGKTSLLQSIAVDSDESNIEFGETDYTDDGSFNITIVATELYHKYDNTNRDKILAYGASRLQLQSEESQDVRNARKSNVYGLFWTDGVLLNIEYWIKMRVLDGETARIDAVCNLLTALLPSVDKVVYGKSPKTGKFRIAYLQDGKEYTIEELSAGNKSILAMIGDIVIRLYETQPETIDPSELYGIVLIDEFEAHLHPKWQRRLPQLLAEHLPNIQFIVTTHSPIIFLGLPPNSLLFNITKDENKKTVVQRLDIDLANVLPNQLLTSDLFGMDSVRSVQNKGIEDLSVSTQQEVDKRKARRERLKELYKDFEFEIPEN